ncbi:MAG: acetyl-CoA C-acyltransferase [Armatimonadetes bacterium CG07_land_8_20_14_0_80_40_9]|nr:MAG: acetyl-CoA C-acyltransferase [Armatimonadetes bacterium CG07_land_8_20_14_0_80_40_9]
MGEALIVDAVRSAVGRARRGRLRYTRPDDMAAAVINALIERTGIDPAEVDDLKLGCAMPEAEQGMNVAKIIQFLTKIPYNVPAVTLNRFCASGLEAISSACYQVAFGDAELIIAGGVESMTKVPMGGFTPRPNPKLAAEYPEPYTPMGITAENVALKYNISRKDQDEFACHSHGKAAKATKEGKFKEEILPLEVNINGKKIIHDVDETIRPDTTLEALATLRPAFKEGGSVTAGNSSPLTDGAAVVLVVSKEKAKALGLKPVLKFISSASAGVPPEIMGMGPAAAVPKVLKKAKMSLKDMDLIELNEAFAAQSVAVIRELKLEDSMDKINVSGGAIALGHPLGCSGARIATTLLYETKRRGANLVLETMCIGGGQGSAAIFERV